MRSTLVPVLTLLIGVAILATPARAQGIARTLDELRLITRPGQTVTITDTSGAEATGRITSMSPAAIRVQVKGSAREWTEGEIRTIRQRVPDSLSNGALWGLGIGAGLMGLGLAAVGVEDGDEGWAVLAVAIYGGIGAGIGVGVDALIRSKQVIYQRPTTSVGWRVSPLVTPIARGARISFRF